MKKLVLISLISIYSINLNGQNLDGIKKENVLFVVFEKSELQKISSTTRIMNDKKFECFEYEFYYKDHQLNNISKYPFSFTYAKYHNFDDLQNEVNESMLFRIHKSFLKKNKNIILNGEYFEKVGAKRIIDLFFRSGKTIFLIDKNDLKGKQILLREVRFNYVAEE